MSLKTLLTPQLNHLGQLRNYINYDVVLSYGMRHNFLVGDRGVGKTFGLTKWVLNRVIKNKEEFVWIRNTQDAVKALVQFDGLKFLADHPEKLGFEREMFTVVKDTMFYGDQVIGTFTTLSDFPKLKGSTRHKAKYFIFDEFMPEAGEIVRIDYEYAVSSILQSVFRTRTDFVAFYTANVLNTRNTMLEFFRFNIQPHFENQVMQINRKKNGVIFYFPDTGAREDETGEIEGDPFAMSNVQTPSPLIIDYVNNLDPMANKNIKKRELIMYVVSDLDYFLIREHGEKIAVLRVKGMSTSWGLSSYALHKKYVFGGHIFDMNIKKYLQDAWNRGMLVFRVESDIYKFTNALFKQ